MIAGAGAGDEQQAAFSLEVLLVRDRVLLGGVTAAGAGTVPASTLMTATAWNFSPFMRCAVPTRTAFLELRVVSARVGTPAALSAERA